MPTIEQIISDVELSVNQGVISDDSALDWSQVKFWISTSLNALISSELNGKIERGENFPSIYIRSITCQVPEIEEQDCGDCNDRVYVELPDGVEVLTLNDDRGILRIITDEGDPIIKASVENLSILQHLRFAKPSENNLLYVRQERKIYIEGMKPSDIDFDFVSVWYIPKQDVMSLEYSDELAISDLTLPILMDRLIATAKLQLYGTTPDVASDGVDVKNPVYHRQISNPDSTQ